ncbi:hypothetical protein DIPPA_02754 [Diplonema papillatum]|nr:hypothetical protein DIPPA_02754 [Diplonema papillatum]
MTIQRADKSTCQSNLFEPASDKDWGKEIGERSTWPQKLKTVEAAKDKCEGMKTRAKFKRGGDGSKNNASTFALETSGEPDASTSTRRAYDNRPQDANVLFIGDMKADDHLRGVRRVDPPAEKKAPKTHKVVNLDARIGVLGGAADKGRGQNAFTVLAGGGTKPNDALKGRRCYGNYNSETSPVPPKPSGRGGRREGSKTDPWKYEKEADSPSSMSTSRQRYVATPPHTMHSFEFAPKQPRYPNYRVNPPYSVGA